MAVYREYLNTCFSQAMSFRLHFVLLIVMDLVFYASSLVSVDFIFAQVDHIGVWNREQFLFFVAFMLAVDQLHMTFISESFWDFSFGIRTGRLDTLLLKPIGAMFCIFFRFIRPGSMLILPVPWAAMIYFGSNAGLSRAAWIALPLLIILALTLITSIEILITMFMFWVVEAWGLNFLRMQLQQMSRWPDFVYAIGVRRLFTFVIPILTVGSAPVRFLFDQEAWAGVPLMIATILLIWLAISVAWRIGLRAYDSASS